MTTARQKILNYIDEQQSATVEELSRVFKVTPANIRHHLSILVGQGCLKIIGQKSCPGKGRPAQIYSPAQLSNQNNLDQLTDTLLTTLFNTCPPDQRQALSQSIATHIANKCVLDKYNPTRRMYSSIRALNRMSYQAHWEAHIENPRIMLGHCPYLSLLDHHPEICQMDAYLLQELMDSPVRLVEKLTLNDRGLAECIFLLDRHLV